MAYLNKNICQRNVLTNLKGGQNFMFKKSLSVVLAILMVFSGFSVSAFANTEETPVTPEPVTYTAQNGSRVKTDIVLLSTVKNELTVIHPGDAVKFVDARGNYVDRPLTVTYYSDVDALLKNSVKNTAFLESRFDLHGNNLYKDVTAASASKALFFQDLEVHKKEHGPMTRF